MDNPEIDENKNFDFLVVKSRELLQEQFKSYESANSKAGILISISALLIPIALSFISNSDTPEYVKIFTIIPTTLMILALTYLLKVLLPKDLDVGFNFDQFERLINNPHKDLQLFEIGANRDSFKANKPIVKAQNRNFKTGVKLIFSSAIILLVLITASLIF
jgi:hypothetical protein